MSAGQNRLWPRLSILALAALAIFAPGCAWLDSLKGDGFPKWSHSLGGTVRGTNPAAQPSGFFTDARSDQIERNLGGGF